MITNRYRTLKYLTFDSFPNDEIIAACFTRLGGNSDEPFDSLNVGSSVGDQQTHVNSNRELIFEAIGRSSATLYDAWQVHSIDYVVAKEPRDLSHEQEKVDILFTKNPSVTLMMRFADCVPIFLYDPKLKAIGMVHAGWAGAIKKIAAIAVKAMQDEFGSSPSNIRAGIGPSIGPDHYEIGPDVERDVLNNFPENAQQFVIRRKKRIFLDLWNINYSVLQSVGLTQIENSEICTACHVDEWFSHRLEKGKTGRFGAVMAIR